MARYAKRAQRRSEAPLYFGKSFLQIVLDLLQLLRSNLTWSIVAHPLWSPFTPDLSLVTWTFFVFLFKKGLFGLRCEDQIFLFPQSKSLRQINKTKQVSRSVPVCYHHVRTFHMKKQPGESRAAERDGQRPFVCERGMNSSCRSVVVVASSRLPLSWVAFKKPKRKKTKETKAKKVFKRKC